MQRSLKKYSKITLDKMELKIDEYKIITIRFQTKAKSIMLSLVIIGIVGYFAIGSFGAILVMIFGSLSQLDMIYYMVIQFSQMTLRICDGEFAIRSRSFNIGR
jgi:uncharacterized membrane protein YuzA (DUF378 family)